jgi:serine/threonine-protein kinase
VLDLLATTGEALDRAHLRGLILADVRPSNVFVDRKGAARLRGFGLVQHARAAWHRLGSDVAFLAPEVLADDEPPLDWRADVWGLAMLAYSAFSLTDPPDFGAIQERAERLFLDLRGAPDGLLPLLERSLDKDPANRPASCGILAEEFRRMALALTPPPPPPPPPRRARPSRVLVAAIAAVTLGVLGWLLLG